MIEIELRKLRKMDFINIDSYQMLQEQLLKTPQAYLLLYKSGSEASDCALENASKTTKEKLVFLVADVSKVRDIHTEYGVKTAPILLSFQDGKLTNSYKGCNDVSFYEKIFEQDYFVTGTDGEKKPQKRVTVYSTPTCSWCTTLKKHLDHHGIRYKDIDISKDSKAAVDMQKRSGQQGVPQTDINGQMIVGFDKSRINTLLGI
jgi:glutaredoxin-like YruB-family protein